MTSGSHLLPDWCSTEPHANRSHTFALFGLARQIPTLTSLADVYELIVLYFGGSRYEYGILLVVE